MPDQVWELNRSEEYWMQESHGLFATKEAAIAAIKLPIVLQKDLLGGIICVTYDKDHYTKHGEPWPGKVWARGGKEVTEENLEDFCGNFEFYDLDHIGYPVYGVFPRTVQS